MKTNLAAFADLQYFDGTEPYKETVLGFHAKSFIDHFKASLLADTTPVSAILELGDRITTQKPPGTDARNMLTVNGWLDDLATIAPVYSLEGNHDFARLRDHFNAQNAPMRLRQAQESYTLDIDGYRIVMFNADYIPMERYKRTDIENMDDLVWLADTLADADSPVIVCSHIPFSFRPGRSYTYQGHEPMADFYPPEVNESLRRIVHNAGNVMLCLTGHLHSQIVDVFDGIPHVTLASATLRCVDDFTKPTMAHYRINLEGTQKISIIASGGDTQSLTFENQSTKGFNFVLSP